MYSTWNVMKHVSGLVLALLLPEVSDATLAAERHGDLDTRCVHQAVISVLCGARRFKLCLAFHRTLAGAVFDHWP